MGRAPEKLTAAVGKPIRYVNLPPEELRRTLDEQFRARGMPTLFVAEPLARQDHVARGGGAQVTETVTRVLGRPVVGLRARSRCSRETLQTLHAGWLAAVRTIVIATLMGLLAPHVRGIGFPIELRFAIVGGTCLVASIAAAFAFRTLTHTVARPRLVLASGCCWWRR